MIRLTNGRRNWGGGSWLGRALVSIALTPAVGLAGKSNAQCRYEVTLLPQLQSPIGPNGGSPRALNNAGQAMGYYTTNILNNVDKPFLWSAAAGLQLIQFPPGTETAQGMDLSDITPASPFPLIVGEVVVTGVGYRGFQWREGTWATLNGPKGGQVAGATSVSTNGIVAGYAHDPKLTDTYVAAYWLNGVVHTIAPTWGHISEARDISPDGRSMVGWMGPNGPSVGAHAFMHRDGVLMDLGVVPGGLSGVANAVNDRDQVVIGGQYTPNILSGFLGKMFLWEDGTFTELINYAGFTHIFCGGINNRSEIVGDSLIIQGGAQVAQRPWIWRDGQMIDLNTLLIHGSGINPEAVGDIRSINDHGQILAQASLGSPPHVSNTIVLLTPVPDHFGDTNCDGTVNVDDLLGVINTWGACPGQFCAADLDRNLTINVQDLIVVIEEWDLP